MLALVAASLMPLWARAQVRRLPHRTLQGRVGTPKLAAQRTVREAADSQPKWGGRERQHHRHLLGAFHRVGGTGQPALGGWPEPKRAGERDSRPIVRADPRSTIVCSRRRLPALRKPSAAWTATRRGSSAPEGGPAVRKSAGLRILVIASRAMIPTAFPSRSAMSHHAWRIRSRQDLVVLELLVVAGNKTFRGLAQRLQPKVSTSPPLGFTQQSSAAVAHAAMVAQQWTPLDGTISALAAPTPPLRLTQVRRAGHALGSIAAGSGQRQAPRNRKRLPHRARRGHGGSQPEGTYKSRIVKPLRYLGFKPARDRQLTTMEMFMRLMRRRPRPGLPQAVLG